MKTLFILMDSLNRHYLRAYNGQSDVSTPSIDRLADRGILFENHYSGSLPCMPARREMMTGRLNFLEAPWGPVEPWDDCLPKLLRDQAGVYSHMITDHYHYFHSGGEGYHTLFDSWEFQRGQEGDAWKPLVEPPPPPEGYRGKGTNRTAYWANESFRDPEDDTAYSTPQCFQKAVEFLEHNHRADNWHLHLEVFDPHEPFDCPQRYRDMYGDEWQGTLYNWPEYSPLDPERDDDAAVAHIRTRYAATLTMADTWLGRLFDKMDELDLWDDTVVVLTTDHGHLLGEHGYWAKNYMFDYAELAHIPLLVWDPRHRDRGTRVRALTATMDLMPTFLEWHGVAAPGSEHGRSLCHLIGDPDEAHHDAVLFGYFGKDINLVDGQYTYCRQPLPDSTLYHHTAMPRLSRDFIPRERLARAELGVFLKHCRDVPHYRLEHDSHRHRDAPDFNPIFDLENDPGQTSPVRDKALENRLAARMKELLDRCDAPDCQYRRMGFDA